MDTESLSPTATRTEPQQQEHGHGAANDEASSAHQSTSDAETLRGLDATQNEKRNSVSDDEESHHVLHNIRSAAKKRLHLHHISASGPFTTFNPTNVHAHIKWKGQDDISGENLSAEPDAGSDMDVFWRSRDQRKGRNSIVSTSTGLPSKRSHRFMNHCKSVAQGLWNMCSTFPYRDIAFWSGWSYTVGSALFIIDGVWSWSPLQWPSDEFAGEEKYGVGLCFFFGALLYVVAAVLAYFEAVNDSSFRGSAMQQLLKGNEEEQKKMLDARIHRFFGHFHPQKKREKREAKKLANDVDPEAGWNTRDSPDRPGSIYPPNRAPAPRRGGMDLGEPEEGEFKDLQRWRWWPTWEELKTHHVFEIGYIACSIQLFGAVLYAMCGIVALPGILDTLAQWQENAAYWIPQMVGSVCFLTAGLLFTIEVQEKWYRIAPTSIGWWIGVWATVGSCGFLVCAVCGPAYGNSRAIYQSDLAAMWGSCGYFLSGFLQWYEAVNKNPVEEIFNEHGRMKSYQVHPI